MFKPVDQAIRVFRTEDNDSIEELEVSFALDGPNSESLERLRNYISRIFDIKPVMARSYKNEGEKDKFSLCIHGHYFKGSEDTHPLLTYMSSCPGLEITQEKQFRALVWIFTFPKNQCTEILNGMKALDLDEDQLEALSKEANSRAAFC